MQVISPAVILRLSGGKKMIIGFVNAIDSIYLMSKTIFMKKFFSKQLLLLLLAPALLSSFISFTDRANFAGEWKLNEGKSELGEFGGRFAARSIKIEQKEDAITISKTAPGFNGEEITTTETLKFDGKESETTVFGSSKKKSTLKWSDDSQSFVINYSIMFERNGQTSEFKGTETWSLKDGALSLITVSSSPRGENTTKAVYNK